MQLKQSSLAQGWWACARHKVSPVSLFMHKNGTLTSSRSSRVLGLHQTEVATGCLENIKYTRGSERQTQPIGPRLQLLIFMWKLSAQLHSPFKGSPIPPGRLWWCTASSRPVASGFSLELKWERAAVGLFKASPSRQGRAFLQRQN